MTAPALRHTRQPQWWSLRAAGACLLLAAGVSSACQGLLGDVDLADAETTAPSAGGATSSSPQLVFPPLLPAPPTASNPGPSEAPGTGAMLEPGSGGSSAGGAGAGGGNAGSGGEAGNTAASPDAGAPTEPPPEPVRPVDVEPPSPLGLVGFEGGGPRLGTCQDGILMGVRPTANPSTDTFGQRLVFIEPICARASVLPASVAPGAPRIAVQRDDALLSWDATEPMLGAPSWEVPDERLVWVPQPETLCPEAAPALVGLTGAYEPPADDGSGTAIIRSMVLECAQLTLAPNGTDVTTAVDGHLLISRADSFAATGSAEYRSACEGGSALSQLLVHSGFWLDGFVLGCSTLHGVDAAPPPAEP